MENPWRQMPHFIYEAHMGLPNVEQLQALNQIMKKQWAACPGTASAAIIGIAGGNGLEHCRDTCEIVYGIDVNTEYLQACARRFQPGFGKRLHVSEDELTTAFQAYGYQQVVREVTDLPNGKQFVRLDYSLETCPSAGGNGQTHTGGPPPGAGRRPGRGRIIQNEYFV